MEFRASAQSRGDDETKTHVCLMFAVNVSSSSCYCSCCCDLPARRVSECLWWLAGWWDGCASWAVCCCSLSVCWINAFGHKWWWTSTLLHISFAWKLAALLDFQFFLLLLLFCMLRWCSCNFEQILSSLIKNTFPSAGEVLFSLFWLMMMIYHP